jgi:dienelactone hydrolase
VKAREFDRRAQARLDRFGASTGAAAALLAAAELPDVAGAVVSRGGRPDLAGRALSHVRAPTLLIVGGRDVPVIELNRLALAQLGGEKELAIIPTRPICSRNPAPWTRLRGWRATGSSAISRQPRNAIRPS